jgi:hypothetical protein
MEDLNFDSLLASAADQVELQSAKLLSSEDYDPSQIYVFLIED